MLAAAACTALLGAGQPASSPAPEPTGCTPTVFPGAGTPGPRAGGRGPGLVLSGAGGGNMPAAALEWMRAHLGSREDRAGNVVVLRASGGREYSDDFARIGRFGWVEEILIPPCASAAEVDALAPRVDGADAVFFAGGDQSHYVAWKHSALIRAVRALYARGGLVGGGSAGLAIQGEIVYDSVAANRVLADGTVKTPDAVRDPLEPAISFTTGLFAWPPLRGTLTDTHFAKRDRFGRLVAFLARIAHDGLHRAPLRGLGVDEGSVVLVEADGSAQVRAEPNSRGAYLVRLDAAPPLRRGTPLRATVRVAHLRDGERFDLAQFHTTALWRAVTVDGSRTPYYSEDPYR